MIWAVHSAAIDDNPGVPAGRCLRSQADRKPKGPQKPRSGELSMTTAGYRFNIKSRPQLAAASVLSEITDLPANHGVSPGLARRDFSLSASGPIALQEEIDLPVFEDPKTEPLVQSDCGIESLDM